MKHLLTIAALAHPEGLQRSSRLIQPKAHPGELEVFDFELTPEEMARMEALDREKRYFTMTYDQIKAWMGDYQIWD